MLQDILLEHVPALAGIAGASYVFYIFFSLLSERSRLKKLGARAPMPPAKIPYFGFDVVYHALKAGRENRTMDIWQMGFDYAGHYTSEQRLMGERLLMTAEPENIKAILAAQFTDYGKGEPFHKIWKDFLGDSIFATDGEMWHGSRQLIRPQFLKSRIADLHTFEKHLQEMISLIPTDGTEIDISDLFYRFTLDSATDFLLGRDVGHLKNPNDDFARAFADIQKFHNDLMRAGPARKFFSYKKVNADLKILNDFVNPFIESTLALKPEQLKAKDDSGYNFLHALSQYTRDRTELRDQLVAILLAGRDTTASTLSWMFHEISKRPDVVAKMRQEVLDIVGPTAKPTYAELKELKYITHVINETLRLYPAVPFNVRLALKDTTLPRGGGPLGLDPVAILKDTKVGYSTIIMQRRKDLFGPDADQFRPERWEGGYAPKNWTYIPFNGGPRICLGQQFAITEMQYVIARMFQEFDGLENREVRKQELKTEVVITPAFPVLVSFRGVEKR